jgi:hypothetical protein
VELRLLEKASVASEGVVEQEEERVDLFLVETLWRILTQKK